MVKELALKNLSFFDGAIYPSLHGRVLACPEHPKPEELLHLTSQTRVIWFAVKELKLGYHTGSTYIL